jgi:hypothetical protein
MSELITDRSEVLRVIADEGEGAVQCRNTPDSPWCQLVWGWMYLGTFERTQWRRTPKPVPPGDLTYEQAVECIRRKEPLQKYIYDHWEDSDANRDWDVNHLAALQAYRRKLTKRVPLGPEDVPPGSVFRSALNTRGEWTAPHSVTAVGVWFVRTNEWAYATLVDGWEIKRPGEDWKPCSKEATE